MNTFLTEAHHTIVPDLTRERSLLPPLLTALTFVTGLVDAFSYLVLGHVFVANMTGNVVFVGFALAGAPEPTVLDSVVALGAFGLGALVGGRLGALLGLQPRRHLGTAATAQAGLLAASVVLAVLSGAVIADGYHYALIVLLGLSMGLQNATARGLGVPDMNTTVLTLTITGIAADSRLAGGTGSMAGRRFVAVGSMLAGALVGASLVIHVNLVYPLLIATALVALVAVAARRAIPG